MLIREAKLEDANDIAHVHVESWKSTYYGILAEEITQKVNHKDRYKMWQDILSTLKENRKHVLVCEVDSHVVGFSYGGPCRSQKESYKFDSEIYAIYLLRNHQKKHIGQKLFVQSSEYLKDSGFKSLVVWSLAENPYCAFYGAMGGVVSYIKDEDYGIDIYKSLGYGWTSLDNVAPQKFPIASDTDQSLLVREVAPYDAKALMNHLKTQKGNVLDNFDGFIKRFDTIPSTKENIYAYLNNIDHKFLVAKIDDEIVASVSAYTLAKKMTSHIGRINLTIQKNFKDTGIETALIECILKWAKSSEKIEKLNVRLKSHQKTLVEAFKDHGFIVEGVLKNNFKIKEDMYADQIILGYITI